jgi:citrate lyase subunit beta/citryl-CoA lyase
MRLRRSLHFVPGANEKMMGKALNLSADALIFDLEDSVTPEAKLAAREAVCEWLDENRECRQERLVRVNPFDSQWGRDDLEAIVMHHPMALCCPKFCLERP